MRVKIPWEARGIRSDPLDLESYMVVSCQIGFREPNLGLLKDQEVLLPGEPLLQDRFLYFFLFFERRLKHDPVEPTLTPNTM